MRIILNIIAALLLLKEALCIEIKCEFLMNSGECKVSSMKVDSENVEITGISGNHLLGKTNNDVKELWVVKNIESEFVPLKFCDFFENLERIDFYGTKIKKLNGKVLKNCAKVLKLCIFYTSLTSLPEDVFNDLTELQELLIYENKFVMLQANLVSKNTKLTKFSANSNELLFFDISFENSVTSVDLRMNKCFNKRFPEDNTTKNISKFNEEVKESCRSPIENSLKVKNDEISNIKKSLKNYEIEIQTLNSYKLKLSQEKEVLARNISQITIENIILKHEIDERVEEIKEIKSNNAEKIKETFNRVIKLHSDAVNCQDKLENIQRDAKRLEQLKTATNQKVEECESKFDSLNSSFTLSSESWQTVQEKLDKSTIEASNFNFSLHECWQNLTLINNFNAELALKTSRLQEKCDNVKADQLKSCQSKIDPVYFILMVSTFAVILGLTVILMRRHAARMLIKSLINQQVSLKGLLSDE